MTDTFDVEELERELGAEVDKAELVVSWSELDTYRQCPKKHDLAYHQRWVAPPKGNGPLDKGVLWHEVLDVHYTTILKHQTTDGGTTAVEWDVDTQELFRLCLVAVDALFGKWLAEDVDPSLIKLLRWMYDGHLEVWGLDEQWDILAVECGITVPLSDTVSLKVKIDLVARDANGRVWLIDHKSCANLPASKDFDWNDQFGLYMWALRKVGVNVFGAMHSAARTKQNQGDLIKPGDEGYKKSMKVTELEDRYRRTRLDKTGPELEEIAKDALADAEQAYSTGNHKRRHTNEDTCKWRCGFNEACMLGRRTGSEAKLVQMLQVTGFEQNFTRH